MSTTPAPAPLGNPERLREVAAAIEANPDHFDMGFWLSQSGTGRPVVSYVSEESVSDWARNDERYTVVTVESIDLNQCGTKACIAGWACALHKDEALKHDSFEAAGIAILGLDAEITEQLFYSDWDASEAADILRQLADGVYPFDTVGD